MLQIKGLILAPKPRNGQTGAGVEVKIHDFVTAQR